jgi:Tol biopolymer transport system component/broad specificity phosphatase PhoE
MESKMKKAITLILILALAMKATIAKADFIFGEPTNLGPHFNTSADDGTYSFSKNGLELYLGSNRPGGYGHYDLYVMTRESVDAEWTDPVNLGSIMNSAYYDSMPCISPDGLELYFNSERPGGQGLPDLWVVKRPTINDPFDEPMNLGPLVNSNAWDQHPTLSHDGLTLCFESSRLGHGDLWIMTRSSSSEDWSRPVNLGAPVNTEYNEWYPRLSPDGRILFFTSNNRPGGLGGIDLWMTTRATIEDSWSVPTVMFFPINTPDNEAAASFSLDGSILYFGSNREGGLGGWDQWQVPIQPVVDLNDDGIVDANDMCIMVDHWGTDNSLCDIGPMPWGDGIVDVEDLKVLAEHLFEESSQRPQVTTVVIVRHAEKSNDSLTEDGEKRAETLARLLTNAGVSAIFSTNYTRTTETANNTAEQLGIPIQFYSSIQGVADLIKSEYAGKVVLVVGHSNTVTQTVRALGVSSVPQFDGRYDNLYIVTIRSDDTALLTHLRFDIHPDL